MDALKRWLAILVILTPQVHTYSTVKFGPRIHGIWACPASMNHFTTIHNYSIGMDRYKMDVINIDGKINRKIMAVSKGSIVIHHCKNGVSADKCEYFATWAFDKNCCALIAKQGVLWTPAIDSVSPRFHCPMDKYYYKLRNATFDYDKFQGALATLPAVTWKFQIKIWNELSELVVCADFITDLRRVKIKM